MVEMVFRVRPLGCGFFYRYSGGVRAEIFFLNIVINIMKKVEKQFIKKGRKIRFLSKLKNVFTVKFFDVAVFLSIAQLY